MTITQQLLEADRKLYRALIARAVNDGIGNLKRGEAGQIIELAPTVNALPHLRGDDNAIGEVIEGDMNAMIEEQQLLARAEQAQKIADEAGRAAEAVAQAEQALAEAQIAHSAALGQFTVAHREYRNLQKIPSELADLRRTHQAVLGMGGPTPTITAELPPAAQQLADQQRAEAQAQRKIDLNKPIDLTSHASKLAAIQQENDPDRQASERRDRETMQRERLMMSTPGKAS